jgi:hypothetical protein
MKVLLLLTETKLQDPQNIVFYLILIYILLLTLSNLIFLPTAYTPALICFGRERGWWITCNYPKEINIEKQKDYNLRYLWLTPTTAHSNQFQLFHDSGR